MIIKADIDIDDQTYSEIITALKKAGEFENGQTEEEYIRKLLEIFLKDTVKQILSVEAAKAAALAVPDPKITVK